LVLAAAVGVGAYFAIVKLGSSDPKSPRDPVVVADAALVLDATVVVVVDAALPRDLDAPSTVVRREKTFTLGSTLDDVVTAQGQPNGTASSISIVNGARSASKQLTYGESSTIDFDGNDKVVGWWERDAPLHVRLEIRDAAAAARAKARGTFKVGSSADEVLGLLGPPSRIAGPQWSYGSSTIDLPAGLVATWTQGEPKLPVAP
jgi:hypothetical protein